MSPDKPGCHKRFGQPFVWLPESQARQFPENCGGKSTLPDRKHQQMRHPLVRGGPGQMTAASALRIPTSGLNLRSDRFFVQVVSSDYRT